MLILARCRRCVTYVWTKQVHFSTQSALKPSGRALEHGIQRPRGHFLMEPQIFKSLAHPHNKTNNIHQQITWIWLAKNQSIFLCNMRAKLSHKCKVVTQVEITISMCMLSKFHLSWLCVILFLHKLSTSNEMISGARKYK